MARIGFIATSPAMYDLAVTVLAEMGLAHESVIRQADRVEAAHVARQMEADGVEVIISRGGASEFIMAAGVRVPLVQVPFSSQELSQALLKAKQMTGLDKPRIALLLTGIMDREIDRQLFVDLLGTEITVYHMNSADEASIEVALDSAIRDRADVVIGGVFTSFLARKRNIHVTVLPVKAASIRVALREAEKVLYAIGMEQARARRFRLVVEKIRDGIMYCNAEGRIEIANPAAETMLGLPMSEIVSRRLDTVLPLADFYPQGDGQHHDFPEREVTDEVISIGGATFIVSLEPLRVGGRFVGGIVSLQESNRIAKMDAKIRKVLDAKGLVAVYHFADIWGRSPVIREAKRLAATYAATDSTVLISGETGSGKELFAQAMHNASRNAGGPFVAVNCAALPPSLLESELFGYEEGAFTGASRRGKPGLIEAAHKGTLFLDEISELDQYGQIRLLRFLQERQIMRLGGNKYFPVSVRVIAATNRNLHDLVQAGSFREDLFYRLNVLSLDVPPLRERTGDVVYLLEKLAVHRDDTRKGLTFSPDALDILSRHAWPGNVRELGNALEKLCVGYRREIIDGTTIHKVLQSPGARPVIGEIRPSAFVGERELIQTAVEKTGGNLSRTAKMLGMHRSTLYRKMRVLGLENTVKTGLH